MALGKQLPIRLEPEIEKRLERVAINSGTTKSALIRFLAKTFVDHAVRADGSIVLPVDWAKLLPSADMRSGYMVAEQRGDGNTINQSLSHLPSDVSARTGAKAAGKKPKRKK